MLMRESADNERHFDRAILLALFAVLLFASPLARWWSALGAPWYLPYLLWLAVVLLGAWLQQRNPRYDL
jgi:hypothetical protein